MRIDTLRSMLARPGILALALVLLVAALYLPWLGYTDLMHEETRRAVIARTMMESGDFLVPMLAERIYLNKPPLFNWMIVATSLPVGTVTEFTARLATVISLAALALVMVFTAGRHLGTPARWLLGVGVIVTGELMHKGVLGNLDVAFTLMVSASLWTWYALDERGRRGLMLWLPPAVLVAAAFLVKREPALVFYYLGIGAFLLMQRRFLELFRPAHLCAAAVTIGLIALWLVPVVDRVGIEAVLVNMQEEVLSRGLSPSFADYVAHFLRYPLEILVAALPTSVLLLALAWPSVWRAVHRRHGRLFVFAVAVTLVNLPIYWLRADVAVRYFLPMFPTLVALAAMVFDTLVAERDAWARSARLTQHGLALFLAVIAAGFGGAMIVLSLPGTFPGVAGPIMPWPVMAAIGLATLAALGYPLVRHRHDLAVVAFVAIIGFGVALRLVEIGYRIPHEAARIVEEHDDVPALLASIRSHLPEDVEHVQSFGGMPHAIWYYDREGLVVPEARWARTGRPASSYLLVWDPRRDRLESLEREVEPVARFRYQDGDFTLMRLPSPTSN